MQCFIFQFGGLSPLKLPVATRLGTALHQHNPQEYALILFDGISGVASPKFWDDKMLDFRQTVVFCLGYRL